MCGIAGGVFWDGSVSRDAAHHAVSRMVDALSHRGPDGRGLMASTPAGSSSAEPFAVFGHTRLAILDLSPSGAQPMGNPASTFITYNGESYRFGTIKRQLETEGIRFSSSSDTEVLLRAYERWGIDVLPRIDGMFAFAIWDQARQRLFIARDRLGIKPLYVFNGDRCLLFASEVRALLATGLVPRRIDSTALWQYLGYQSVPAPRTLVASVRAILPGHWLTAGPDAVIAEGEYWHMLAPARDPIDVSPEEARGRVGELLRDAVRAQMVSDVPVGAFLSGGIDSSAVVGLMREAGHTPRTFSIGFAEQAFDETPYSRMIAERFTTEHSHITLTADDLLESLGDALRAMDQPTGDAVNTFVVSGAVRARGIAVAHSGLGGDEIFGGYPSFSRLARIADLARLWGRSPETLRAIAGGVVRALGQSSVQSTKAAAVVESDGAVSSMFPLLRQLLSTEQRRALLTPQAHSSIDHRDDPYDRLLEEAYAGVPEAGLFARISYAEARTYMHDVLLRDTDQMSMAHGLEVRVPLLDHPLVEYVASLPDRLKQTHGTPKRLLVESLGGLLPDAIVHRPKQGFTLPFDLWMRGPLRGFCEEHLGDRGLGDRGLFQAGELQCLWQSFLRGGSSVSWSRLWTLVVLDAWLARHELQA